MKKSKSQPIAILRRNMARDDKQTEQRPFQKEYVLARGYPIFNNARYNVYATGYTSLSMSPTKLRVKIIAYKIPEELLYDKTPYFELVLRPRRKKKVVITVEVKRPEPECFVAPAAEQAA